MSNRDELRAVTAERDELAAVVNGADWTSKSESIADAILTAGYTTRRAVIEELVEKLDSEIWSLASQLADEFDYGAAYSLGEEVEDLRRVRDRLHAELESPLHE